MYEEFIKSVWDYYNHNKRSMPWRELAELSTKNRGYRVMVSEVMLQQTQVSRVINKYDQWMQRWPTIDDFYSATLAEVLVMWNGLGYNRRAKYLYEALKRITVDFDGIIPNSVTELQNLPGIGPNTAAAIIVYAYNVPLPYVETNIRTVYLQSFFTDSQQVTDKQILAKVIATLDNTHPREWYYALMDYGAYIKKSQGNQLLKAKAHKKQSAFKNSNRQLRGSVLRLLTQVRSMSYEELETEITDERLHDVIENLLAEGLIIKNERGTYELPNR